MRKIDALSVRGPVDGMGESDLRGDYYLAALHFEDDELVRGRLTKGQLEEIRDNINAILAK